MIGNLVEKPENLKTVSHHRLMTQLMQARYGITFWRRGNNLSNRRYDCLSSAIDILVNDNEQ